MSAHVLAQLKHINFLCRNIFIGNPLFDLYARNYGDNIRQCLGSRVHTNLVVGAAVLCLAKVASRVAGRTITISFCFEKSVGSF